MSGVPEGIMKAARKIGAARYEGSQWKHMRQYFEDGMYDNDPVVVEAVSALLAERNQAEPSHTTHRIQQGG